MVVDYNVQGRDDVNLSIFKMKFVILLKTCREKRQTCYYYFFLDRTYHVCLFLITKTPCLL